MQHIIDNMTPEEKSDLMKIYQRRALRNVAVFVGLKTLIAVGTIYAVKKLNAAN